MVRRRDTQWHRRRRWLFPGDLAVAHQCASASFGGNKDEAVIVVFHDETLSVGWRHGEGQVTFTLYNKPDLQGVSTFHFIKLLIILVYCQIYSKVERRLWVR